MDFLVRLVQFHEDFRRAELEALSVSHGVKFEYVSYHEKSPFCIIRVEGCERARELIRDSILSRDIYEIWGTGRDYASLHEDVRKRTEGRWPAYHDCSFRFEIDAFQSRRTSEEQVELIAGFNYLDFAGPIKMRGAQEHFYVGEHWDGSGKILEQIYFGRWVGTSTRDTVRQMDLKKRVYISTTSMDAELSLITANMTCARPGKLFLDPFVGTGSFPVACAHFGTLCVGADIDGRMIKGKQSGRNIKANFAQYGLSSHWVDAFIGDLTNSPIRSDKRLFDGILCDPPYGVREGLKVLGRREELRHREPVYIDGVAAHTKPDFVPPKRSYSFEAILADILAFAVANLVDGGRLGLWMPAANDGEPVPVPAHGALRQVSLCVQPFYKWSRRLITYERIPDALIGPRSDQAPVLYSDSGNASDLNAFRRRYFEGFR